MALALGVRLAKPGGYVLNGQAHKAGPMDTRRATKIAGNVVLMLVPVLLVVQGFIATALAFMRG